MIFSSRMQSNISIELFGFNNLFKLSNWITGEGTQFLSRTCVFKVFDFRILSLGYAASLVEVIEACAA